MKGPTDVIDREDMKRVAAALDKLLPELIPSGKRLGFGILVFDFGEKGNIQWASNAERADMIAALRELLGKWAADGSVHN